MILIRINNNPDFDRLFINKNDAQVYINSLNQKENIKTIVL